LRVLTPRFGSAAVPFALLLPLSAAGIVVALRRRRREHLIVVLTVTAMAATVVLFFVTGRYRIPLVPGLTVLAALGGQALAQGLRAHVREASAAAVAFAFAVLPLRLPIDAVPFEAEMYYAIGGRRARLGDDTGAVAAWSKAVQLRPGYLEAGVNLGLALERLGHRDLAASAYRQVLRSHPGVEQRRTVCRAGRSHATCNPD
jgi:tetratricopeptide (TPR) repeat protein